MEKRVMLQAKQLPPPFTQTPEGGRRLGTSHVTASSHAPREKRVIVTPCHGPERLRKDPTAEGEGGRVIEGAGEHECISCC